MNETLLSDLVAIVRRSPEACGGSLRARLAGRPGVPSQEELEELVRRARSSAASDEELALSFGALIATTRASTSPR
jgi:hypothetical protein